MPDGGRAGAMQVFFCKYNDPSYVKLEKLEVIIKLATAANMDQVLMEFREYASEVDVDFVRKARPAPPPPSFPLSLFYYCALCIAPFASPNLCFQSAVPPGAGNAISSVVTWICGARR